MIERRKFILHCVCSGTSHASFTLRSITKRVDNAKLIINLVSDYTSFSLIFEIKPVSTCLRSHIQKSYDFSVCGYINSN